MILKWTLSVFCICYQYSSLIQILSILGEKMNFFQWINNLVSLPNNEKSWNGNLKHVHFIKLPLLMLPLHNFSSPCSETRLCDQYIYNQSYCILYINRWEIEKCGSIFNLWCEICLKLWILIVHVKFQQCVALKKYLFKVYMSEK